MTIEVSRRQLMASMGGMVLASFALPSALRKALDNAPASVLSHRSKVRADLRDRARGRADAGEPVLRPLLRRHARRPRLRRPHRHPGVFKQPDSDNPDGYLYRSTPTPQHQRSEPAVDQPRLGAAARLVEQRRHERLRDRAQHHDDSDGNAGQYSMAYFKRDDIPFQWALADAFTICDGYHSSVMGPTWPNRLYLMTGQIDPTGGQRRPDLRQLRCPTTATRGRPTRRCCPRPACPGRCTRRSITTASTCWSTSTSTRTRPRRRRCTRTR